MWAENEARAMSYVDHLRRGLQPSEMTLQMNLLHIH